MKRCKWLCVLMLICGGSTCGTQTIGPAPVTNYDGKWRLEATFDNAGQPSTFILCLTIANGEVASVQDGCNTVTNLTGVVPVAIDDAARITFSFAFRRANVNGEAVDIQGDVQGIEINRQIHGTVNVYGAFDNGQSGFLTATLFMFRN